MVEGLLVVYAASRGPSVPCTLELSFIVCFVEGENRSVDKHTDGDGGEMLTEVVE